MSTTHPTTDRHIVDAIHALQDAPVRPVTDRWTQTERPTPPVAAQPGEIGN